MLSNRPTFSGGSIDHPKRVHSVLHCSWVHYTLPVVVVFQRNICDLPIQVFQDLVLDVHVSDVCIRSSAVVPTKNMCFCFELALCILCKLVCCPKMRYIHIYTMLKNHQLFAILLKTGLNNVVLPTLLIVVNNIVQHCCHTRFRLNNIVQYC